MITIEVKNNDVKMLKILTSCIEDDLDQLNVLAEKLKRDFDIKCTDVNGFPETKITYKYKG
jgi:tetrahydromethanopterin S-methyltransferase subunit B